MLPPNSLLHNRYRIIRALGRGGFGNVYEAIDNNLDCIVAIKERHADLSSEKLLKAFKREAQLLANLSHPVLPRVSDHFFDSNGQFLVMEFIEGPDLAERLMITRRPFQYDEVLSWADDLLRALEYLHYRQIIHRDIKPRNIKLTSEGRIYLLDFGLAKGAAGGMPILDTEQRSSSVYGYTEEYAPLEQITKGTTTEQSDLYSMGGTLYHLLTGRRPLKASERYDQIDSGRWDPLPQIHEINPEVPMEVSVVVAQAMAISRRDRLTTATIMRQALIDAKSVLDSKQASTKNLKSEAHESIPSTLKVNAPPHVPPPQTNIFDASQTHDLKDSSVTVERGENISGEATRLEKLSDSTQVISPRPSSEKKEDIRERTEDAAGQGRGSISSKYDSEESLPSTLPYPSNKEAVAASDVEMDTVTVDRYRSIGAATPRSNPSPAPVGIDRNRRYLLLGGISLLVLTIIMVAIARQYQETNDNRSNNQNSNEGNLNALSGNASPQLSQSESPSSTENSNQMVRPTVSPKPSPTPTSTPTPKVIPTPTPAPSTSEPSIPGTRQIPGSGPPPRVNLFASPTTLRMECNENTPLRVRLKANGSDPSGRTLRYTYNTTGGRLIGEGSSITWDLTGVSPGTYTATVEADNGAGAVAFDTISVKIIDDCSQ